MAPGAGEFPIMCFSIFAFDLFDFFLWHLRIFLQSIFPYISHILPGQQCCGLHPRRSKQSHRTSHRNSACLECCCFLGLHGIGCFCMGSEEWSSYANAPCMLCMFICKCRIIHLIMIWLHRWSWHVWRITWVLLSQEFFLLLMFFLRR